MIREPKTGIESLGWGVMPLVEDYRHLPIEEAFNWPKLIGEIDDLRGEASSYYLVVFRSLRLQGAEISDELGQLVEHLDAASLNEAKESLPGALLHYFAGTVDEAGNALSWCLWTDRESAKKAIHSPIHSQAIQAAHHGELYARYDLERYMVRLDDNEVVFERLGADGAPERLEAGLTAQVGELACSDN